MNKVAAFALLGCLTACTDAFLEPKPVEQTQIDDQLSLSGRVCTSPPRADGFPVKVVFVVDESGSMCVSDPPGAQGTMGFCERIAPAVVPPGETQPARVRALKKLVQQFQDQPNTQVAIVPFETNVKNPWPTLGSGSRFARPDNSVFTYIDGLQSQLGKGTDYQGALSYAYTLIAGDIDDTHRNNPELLPRTRYVVVFLTDGTPYPRCSANDDLTTYADPYNPDLTWSDSSSAVQFCNLLDTDERSDIFGTSDDIVGYTPGTDRNQNYQLFGYIDDLIKLKEQYNIGDLRVHTVLLFNEAAVAACNALGTNSQGRPLCEDIYGTYPNVPPDQYPQAAKQIAAWTLEQMAVRGNGIFQEFTNGDIQSLSLGALDYSSLASENVMKELFVQSLTSVPGADHREVDSDGDGIPDSSDNSFTTGTNAFAADSDEDCFDDSFETRHVDEGFRAANEKDSRGCDPDSPLMTDCFCRDTDGDGLSQYAETFLTTRAGMVDSDGDGIPDGLEARYGLNPLERSANTLDTDGDGITDLAEIRAGSDPTRQDASFFERRGYQYDVTAHPQDDGSVCYDFTISNLQLVTPPPRAGTRQGYNLFKIWFAQAPASGVATDYGEWRSACAWAQYAPPGVRAPAGTELNLDDSNFLDARELNTVEAYNSNCVGTAP